MRTAASQHGRSGAGSVDADDPDAEQVHAQRAPGQRQADRCSRARTGSGSSCRAVRCGPPCAGRAPAVNRPATRPDATQSTDERARAGAAVGASEPRPGGGQAQASPRRACGAGRGGPGRAQVLAAGGTLDVAHLGAGRHRALRAAAGGAPPRAGSRLSSALTSALAEVARQLDQVQVQLAQRHLALAVADDDVVDRGVAGDPGDPSSSPARSGRAPAAARPRRPARCRAGRSAGAPRRAGRCRRRPRSTPPVAAQLVLQHPGGRAGLPSAWANVAVWARRLKMNMRGDEADQDARTGSARQIEPVISRTTDVARSPRPRPRRR